MVWRPLRGCAALRPGEVVGPDYLVRSAIQMLAELRGGGSQQAFKFSLMEPLKRM